MYSPGTSSSTTGPWNISDVAPRFGSTKLVTAIIRGALAFAVLSALLIAALPAQAQPETVLYNFTGGSDSGYPMSRLTSDGAGNFYGTTAGGDGAGGFGTVFELSPNGSGGWNETVLYSFTGGADGSHPWYSPVILDSAGNLYGTTYQGGTYGGGAVFKVDPRGRETVLYSFCSPGCFDGMSPESGVIMDSAGNLYGVNSGGVFELSPSGGGWTYQSIYTLYEYSITPAGLTMDAAGNIFGVSASTVFEVSKNPYGYWDGGPIHTFTGAPKDGDTAYGTLVLDKDGNVYGTTYYGGLKNNGTVYKLSPITQGKKKGQWKEKILHSFGHGRYYGYNPFEGVVLDAVGNIYGATYDNGGPGTVFELVAPVGKGQYKVRFLWIFTGSDGYSPNGLILDSAGNLYGSAEYGGSSGYGVVFEVTP